MPKRKPYPSNVTDEEWAFVAPYLALVREDAAQRRHDLRQVDRGYAGEQPAEQAEAHGIRLEVVNAPALEEGLRALA